MANPEFRRKLSESKMGKPSYIRTPEIREKTASSHRGKPGWSKGIKRPEHSKAMKELWKDPKRRLLAKRYGDAQAADPEWRKKIAEKLRGDKNPNWQGGLTQSDYAPGFSQYLKRKIRKRDKYQCQLCGITEAELGHHLSIHHADYNKTNHKESNLHAVCRGCNSRVNTTRDKWLPYFIVISEARQFGQDISKFLQRKIITQHKGYAIIDLIEGPSLAGTMIEDIVRCISSSVART